jgi:hypothetical protein
MQADIDRMSESNRAKDTRIELAHREIQELNLKISNLEILSTIQQKTIDELEADGALLWRFRHFSFCLM